MAEEWLPTVEPRDTLIRALAAIELGGVESALVVEGGRLVGLLTDGDARRALLRGAGLDSLVSEAMQRHFTSVGPEIGRAEVLDIMKARRFGLIPITGPGAELIGLHTLHGLIGSAQRHTPAMILCGGMGTRLQPITKTIPKPMITVAGRPILERIILHLMSHGIHEIYLAIHYLGEQIESYFGDGKAVGCQIRYLREDRPLGTGGALTLLPEAIRGPILVMNGDLITQFDAGRMIDQHVEQGHVATMGVQAYCHEIPFGVVDIERDQVLAIREKPAVQYQVNAGIYVLDSALRFHHPAGEPTTIPAILDKALGRGEPIGYFLVDDNWADVGRHDELSRARGQA